MLEEYHNQKVLGLYRKAKIKINFSHLQQTHQSRHIEIKYLVSNSAGFIRLTRIIMVTSDIKSSVSISFMHKTFFKFTIFHKLSNFYMLRGDGVCCIDRCHVSSEHKLRGVLPDVTDSTLAFYVVITM